MNRWQDRFAASWCVTVAVTVGAGLFVLGSGGACNAQQGVLGPWHATVRLPDVGDRVLGFTSQIEIANESAAGYIPLRISVTAQGKLPADRHLIYRFETSPGGQTPPRNGLTVDVPISLQQGMTSESFIRYLPKWSAGMAMEVSVMEDGRVLGNYTGFVGGAVRRSRRAKRELLRIEHKINWVFISPEDHASPKTMPDLRCIAPAGDQVELETTGDASTYWAKVLYGPQFLAIGQKDVPSDWRAYQRYDVIVLESSGLERLRTNDRGFQAVRGWVLNGGMVIVYDAESPESMLKALNFRWTQDADSAERIRAIANWMNYEIDLAEKELKEEIPRIQKYVDRFEAAGKSTLDGGQLPPRVNAEFEDIQSYFPGNISVAKDQLKSAKARMEQLEKSRSGQDVKSPIYSNAQWGKQIWMQPVGAGVVVGIVKSDHYTVPPLPHWQIATKTIDYRASPMIRRGVDPLVGDRRFAKWMIPGVAQPPVYTFMGLLTAFVVLVGPVAYRRTAKQGRSYLMFAIAPALAFVTTVAMFGYGIMSDGFGTVVRARQLTWVDGRSGDAGERIRTTYFAGVRPAGGLRFPGDAEVIGYPEGVGKSWEDLSKLSPATIGRVSIREDAQTFDSSFLPSRQQRQFVVHAPRNDVGYVQLITESDAKSSPSVKNGFDFVIHEAVIRDSDGAAWYVEHLAAGETGVCVPLLGKDASKTLGRIYNDHRPLSAVRETRRRQRYNNEMYDVIVDANRQLGGQMVVSEGIFELWLQLHLQQSGEIPRNHFVATADVSADALAVDGSELVDSIRYVFGTLR